jgi:lysophospholipase L1-like esterase
MNKFNKYIFLILMSLSIFFLMVFFLVGFDFYNSYKNLKLEVSHGDANDRYAMHRSDNHLGWALKSGEVKKHRLPNNFDVVYKIDQNGFKEIQNSNNPKRNIYFFGDSFTFGYGVQNKDTFPNILKDKYLSKRINVFNTGVMGYGITQMYQQFLNLNEKIKPGDIVIFTPSVSDIERNLQDFSFPYQIAFSNALFFEQFPLYENHQMYYPEIRRTAFNFFKMIALSAPLTGFIWEKVNNRFHSDTKVLAKEMLSRAKEMTEKRGALFMLAFLPMDDECEFNKFNKDISQFENHSLLEDFPHDHEQLRNIIFKTNDHWNVHGHEIAAKGILKLLVKNNFLDRTDLKH